jgi:plastocyanin
MRFVSIAALVGLVLASACSGGSSTGGLTGPTGTGTGGGKMGGSGGTGGGGAGGNAVTVGNNFFNPTSNTVAVNTTVTWTWNPGGVDHTVTFDDGGTSSGPQSSGTFSRTFTAPGVYTYYCMIHGRAVMSGAITVQ